MLEKITSLIHRQPEQKSELLASSDKYCLRKGLEKLYQNLEERGNKQLPQVFFFPETAGRLLIYAVRPVLERVYEDRSLDVPPIVVINTPKQGQVKNSEEGALQRNLSAQVHKAVSINKLDGLERVMVIDDDVYRGRTLKFLQKAFNDLDEEIEVENFVFLAGYGGTPANTIVGNPGIPSPETAQIFTQKNETVTGVNKDSGSVKFGVEKSNKRDPEKMQSIRQELETLGQSVVEEI